MNNPDKFWKRVKVGGPDECWPWTGFQMPNGYGTIGYMGRRLYTHRLAYELVNGSVPAGLGVLHKCDNPPCCNPNHLIVGTQLDNMRDASAKGRMKGNLTGAGWSMPGENNPHAKLSEQQVREIKLSLLDGENPRSLAVRYGVSRPCIYSIKSGDRWGHLAAV